jgi:predicted aminopeptidase
MLTRDESVRSDGAVRAFSDQSPGPSAQRPINKLAVSLLRLFVLFVSLYPLSGCYYLQAFTGQMEILSKREPIERVIDRPATAPELRSRLEYVAAARDFASRELGLPDNKSYRSYADLGRPYVVWNVFATEEFSVQPKRWCFPVAGCVVYRGYFREQAAKRYAQRLHRRGYDTAIGAVPAYSTLGHFDDPVLNTMLGWSDAQLAATLFHELAHQVVYVPGDSDFNEGFATVVEEEGLERWLTARGAKAQLDAWRAQRARHREFIDLLLRTRERLKTLYASALPADEMRSRKQYEFGLMKLEYERLKASWGGYSGYDGWFSRTLNNAHLVSAATYHGCVPGLRRVLDLVGGDLEKFYARMKAIAGKEGASRRSELCRSES